MERGGARWIDLKHYLEVRDQRLRTKLREETAELMDLADHSNCRTQGHSMLFTRR